MSRRAVRAVWLLLALVSCGGPLSAPWTSEGPATSLWSRALAAWTRSAEAYEAFEGRLFATATCQSPAFVEAWARHRAHHDGWPADRLDAALATAARESGERLRFLVGITPQDLRWQDAGPGGTLEFTLQADGRLVAPTATRKLSEDDVGDLVPIFTWLTPLHTVFTVDFPAQVAPKRLELRIAGPPARLDLIWELPP